MKNFNLFNRNRSIQLFHPVKLQLVPPQTAKVLVIFDSAVAGYQTLIRDIASTAKIVVLDANRNGVEQITETLSRCTALESLQIIAQSYPGSIQLGSIWLNHTALETHSNQLQAWRQALTPTARILVHGSRVAMGIEGMAFLGRLSQITGTMVATSGTPLSSVEQVEPPLSTPSITPHYSQAVSLIA